MANNRWKALDEIYQVLRSFAPLRPQEFSKLSSRILVILKTMFKTSRQDFEIIVAILAETLIVS